MVYLTLYSMLLLLLFTPSVVPNCCYETNKNHDLSTRVDAQLAGLVTDCPSDYLAVYLSTIIYSNTIIIIHSGSGRTDSLTAPLQPNKNKLWIDLDQNGSFFGPSVLQSMVKPLSMLHIEIEGPL